MPIKGVYSSLWWSCLESLLDGSFLINIFKLHIIIKDDIWWTKRTLDKQQNILFAIWGRWHEMYKLFLKGNYKKRHFQHTACPQTHYFQGLQHHVQRSIPLISPHCASAEERVRVWGSPHSCPLVPSKGGDGKALPVTEDLHYLVSSRNNKNQHERQAQGPERSRLGKALRRRGTGLALETRLEDCCRSKWRPGELAEVSRL